MRSRYLTVLFVGLVFALASAPASLSSQTAATAPATKAADAAAVRIQTFEKVWQIVNDKFYDPNFNGVDWNGVRERYAPRIARLKTDAALYETLTEMLGELKASHFGILPPQAADGPVDGGDASWGGDVGMTVRMIDDRPTITHVEADGPAAEAGLRPGFVVTRVGKQQLAEIHKRAVAHYDRPVMRAFRVRRAIESLLGGMPGTMVEVAYLDASDDRRTASVTRRDAPGQPLKFGQMPTVLARVESSRLANGVGYLKFNIFMPAMMDDIRAAVRSFKDAPGVILDLRGNPGGVGVMAPAIAALFEPAQSVLGTMKMRKGEIRFVTFVQPDPYTGPLVILIDEGSASTSEVMAGGMQENGRAAVVGGASLGAVLPSLLERLPNGAILQYAVADFKTPKGVMLEGRGVLPDVVVAPSRRDYLAGRDPVLDAALKHME